MGNFKRLAEQRESYPDAPGYKERGGTSQQAAASVGSIAESLRRTALMWLRAFPGGLTPDEIARKAGETVLAMRPRLSELGRTGLVEKTSLRRANASGKSATVLRITAHGLRVVE